MLNILIVYAVEEERVHLSMPNCRFKYCRTGVGKVAAALAVEKAFEAFHPDVVLNIGTAGTVDHEIGTIHLCCQFIDRDMEKLQQFGVPFEVDFSDQIKDLGWFKNWKFDSICNTGDTFLTQSDGTGDIFDMESFAVAQVCKKHDVPFVGVKCVTDIIGQNSIKHWEDKLAEAQSQLQQFVDSNPINVPQNFIGAQIKKIIKELDLDQHPEGGWFKEVYRSNMILNQRGLPSEFGDDRSALTSIYYMLANEQYSAFHKIKSPEVWYFHKGMPLTIHMMNTEGNYSKIVLSDQKGDMLQYTVNPNTWFAATIEGEFGYSLVSCAVAPGFEFADFCMADESELIAFAPQHEKIIRKLCK